MADMTSDTTNGNGQHTPTPPPFKINRHTLMGVAEAYMDIAERVVNKELGPNEATAATKALNGVPMVAKTQLEAIKIYEKGSEKAREALSSILDPAGHDARKAIGTS